MWAGAFAARQPAPAEGLTGEVQLLRAYDAIFDARFDDVPAILARTCGPAPAEACQLLAAVTVWWQIQLDPASLARDASFQSKVDAAIAAADAWTKREPQRAEAWFYLGGAYGARAQWRVLRGERLGAARDGKRIKESLERALVLDPGLRRRSLASASTTITPPLRQRPPRCCGGCCYYRAETRPKGCRRCCGRASMARCFATRPITNFRSFTCGEQQPQRALDLLMQLRDRHPRNPLFPQLIAQVQDV